MEGGRQEALLCQSYPMKIPANPFPFVRTHEGESLDSGSSSTTLLAFAVAVPTGQDNDVPRTSGAGDELDWAEARSSTACKGSPRRRLLTVSGVLALMVASFGLTACESARSYERASDGSTVYLDELSDATKADARQKIVATLTRGIDVYDLGVGDEIEIFFHVERKPTLREYVISVADKLHVEFLADTENSRTVQVRPDGRISLPLIGPVMSILSLTSFKNAIAVSSPDHKSPSTS
jgi:polysaccharide biosynthesis/export protein